MPLGSSPRGRAIGSLRRTRDPFENVRQIRRERRLGWIALVLTLVFFVGAEWHTVGVIGSAVGQRDFAAASLALLFALVLLTLMSGSVLYQACRFGFLERVTLDETDRFPGVPELL